MIEFIKLRTPQLVALVAALLTLATAFGLKLSADQLQAISMAVVAVVTFVNRGESKPLPPPGGEER